MRLSLAHRKNAIVQNVQHRFSMQGMPMSATMPLADTRTESKADNGKEILVLCHRIPFPPNKGDKIRSYNIVRHLARQGWRIHLGTLVDDPGDMAHQEALRPLCASLKAEPVPRWRALRSPLGVLRGTSLSVECFRSKRLQGYVDEVLGTGNISAVLAVSAPMAQYLCDTPEPLPPATVLDLVDVDSEKWRAYVERSEWPMRWVYGLEARLLGRYERMVGEVFKNVVVVSDTEAELFNSNCGGNCAVKSITNGVNLRYYSASDGYNTIVPGLMVFCGAMDYLPNIDAVEWFSKTILPLIRQRIPEARFLIVGSKPTVAVRSLEKLPGVRVTGAVGDVRPYVRSAALSVAPMRVARGVQNKVLEAMAMGKAVLATPQAFDGIDADPHRDLAVAQDDPKTFAEEAMDLLAHAKKAAELGIRARLCMENRYTWEARLAPLDALLE